MATILSVMMLAAFALVAGAVFLWRRPGVARRQPLLMLLLAAIILSNVAIWTLPSGDGQAPLDTALR